MIKRLISFAVLLSASILLPAVAQEVTVDLGTGAGLNRNIVQLIAIITVLSLAPSILVMTTSFVRIVVVLSLLRTAIGLQQSPAKCRDHFVVFVPNRLCHGANL